MNFKYYIVDRLLREPSSSKGYNTKRLKSLESASQHGMERMQTVPAAKRAKISKPKQPVTRLPDAAIGKKLPAEPYQLPSPTECSKCRARKFAFETAHFCCGDGEVKIVANDDPAQLVRLLTSMDEDAKHFRQYIRLYNNMFAFTSLGGKFDAKTKIGIYVFKLHGQLYHYIPYLLPGKEGPKYMQLYFYDGELEAKKRLGCFPELREDVLAILMEVTKRVYNAPSTDEVSVIWPENTSSSESESPHILVTAKKEPSEHDSLEDDLPEDDSLDNDSSRKKSCHRIMHYYGCYDPLQYPRLFPYGDCGWTQGASGGSSKTNRNISAREYYAYKLQCRPNNMLLKAGRCFQQYIVDMYVKVENTRLNFFRRNQQTIRADLYQGILDTIDCGENCAANVERRVILPPTFIGGPRDLKKRYLNAMSLVQRFGKPDLFVTMTYNANWLEIKQELAVGEKVQDRPDIVARIFRAKVLALKHLIKKKKVFGEVATMIYVIEFQKRGLPHAHFLIILKQDYKIKCPADFDKFFVLKYHLLITCILGKLC
ncbi:uncharacterized protein LOC110710611 [Chenopodium quinoa]|uniref:uncharacterized protein LOC110710611 n=1 Tax=Chenopodium quinoa TaxID=63459 RepID=UPI000B76C4E2|nr:uncharacterized protein LOC110710611 [Chenopodium quinoa]